MDLFYGKNNLGVADNTEAIGASGDSGGPAFLIKAGSKQNIISAVFAGAGSFDFRVTPDVKDLKSGVAHPSNSTFGEVAFYTRVSSYTDKSGKDATRDNFLWDTIATSPYHITLDMNYQTLGARSGTGLGARSPNAKADEVIGITAKMNGTKIELWIDEKSDGKTDALDGLYFSEEASNIISLTIRGSDDKEAFLIDGPLDLGGTDGKGLDAKIALVGREGQDAFYIGRPATGTIDSFAVPISIDGGPGHDYVYIYDEASATNNTYTF